MGAEIGAPSAARAGLPLAERVEQGQVDQCGPPWTGIRAGLRTLRTFPAICERFKRVRFHHPALSLPS